MESLPQISAIGDGGAPKFRNPQSQEETKLWRRQGSQSLGGSPIPEELEKHMGTPLSPRAGMGDPEAVSGQRQNIDWLVGRAPWRGRLRLAPWWLRAGPKAQGGLR